MTATKGRKPSSPNPPILYRPAEVAKMLRCSEWWVKEQARNRRIPFSWIGGSYLFTDDHVAEIVRLFEERPAPRSSAAETTPSQRNGVKRDPPKKRLHARPPRRAMNSRNSSSDAA
jgi:hypothetical protein